MIFEEECLSFFILLADQILLSGRFYFVRDWPIRMCIAIVMDFNLIFQIKPFFLHYQQAKTKILS